MVVNNRKLVNGNTRYISQSAIINKHLCNLSTVYFNPRMQTFIGKGSDVKHM
jgi:hypothetical protein